MEATVSYLLIIQKYINSNQMILKKKPLVFSKCFKVFHIY